VQIGGMNFQTRSSAGTNHAAHKSNFCLDGVPGAKSGV